MRSVPGKPRRRKRCYFIWGSAVAAVALVAACCVGPPGYYFDKYSPSEASMAPSGVLPERRERAWIQPPIPVEPPRGPQAHRRDLAPERQVEPHTCGLHTLSTIYRAYGLDPEAHRLRFRVGVDKPVSNLLPDTMGAIHPDMRRVLRQDGFHSEVLLPSASQTPAKLAAHLRAGHVAAALIKVDELHWVALSRGVNEKLVVCDSLQKFPYEEELEPYVRERIYSLVLIRPAE